MTSCLVCKERWMQWCKKVFRLGKEVEVGEEVQMEAGIAV